LVSVGKRGPHRGGGKFKDRKWFNRAVVLELVRTQGPISKSELARVGRLNIAIISDVVEELMAEGLVKEIGTGPSTGGRRPMLLGLVAEAYCAVGLTVGTRTLTAVVTDLNATVRGKIQARSEMGQGPEALARRVREVLGEILKELPAGLGEVLGIGLALPAPVFDTASQVGAS
jgi:hypothetical protein